MFKYKNVEKLFSHQIYDYIIRFIKNDKFDFDFLYDMFRDEFTIFKKYFIDNLKKISLKAIKLIVIFLYYLFVNLIINYDFVLIIEISTLLLKKNRYLLFLFKINFMRLCAIKYFIVINIIVVFNHLKKNSKKKLKTFFRIRYDLFEYLILFFDFFNVFVI